MKKFTISGLDSLNKRLAWIGNAVDGAVMDDGTVHIYAPLLPDEAAALWTDANAAGAVKFAPKDEFGSTMRRFVLNRIKDVSGVSGTGIVAEGIQFSDGQVAVKWVVGFRSVALWENIAAVIAVNGGDTVIVWLDNQ
jgi:hypothetical protein